MAASTNFGKKYYLFLIIFLGMMSAFGPFVTDMYLPTLPSMADIFGASASAVQMGLSASMFGLAVGQIIFGPLSDKYGRRSILMLSMVLFSVSTAVCIFSPTIEFFNVCRFVQGLGGAGGIVLSRSISSDCYTGRDLAKMLAIIGAVNGIAPVTAPVIGGLVSEQVGWQGIFWILLGIGLVLLSMCFLFRESHPSERRFVGKISSLFNSFPWLLSCRQFIGFVIMFGFANGVLFSYISSASFIVQNHFGFTELTFSLVFAVNAIGIGIGSGLSLKFKRIQKAGVFGAVGVTSMAVLQLVFLSADSFWVYEALTFMTLVFLGFIFTSSTTMAMDAGRQSIGAASAIVGAVGFLFGGVVSPIVGIGDILLTTMVITAICAVASLGAGVAAAGRNYGEMAENQ